MNSFLAFAALSVLLVSCGTSDFEKHELLLEEGIEDAGVPWINVGALTVEGAPGRLSLIKALVLAKEEDGKLECGISTEAKEFAKPTKWKPLPLHLTTASTKDGSLDADFEKALEFDNKIVLEKKLKFSTKFTRGDYVFKAAWLVEPYQVKTDDGVRCSLRAYVCPKEFLWDEKLKAFTCKTEWYWLKSLAGIPDYVGYALGKATDLKGMRINYYFADDEGALKESTKIF